jgi:protoporphyrinogen oxidase
MEINKPINLERRPIIIGAGPAGLTAAHELTKYNLHPIVIEKLDKVGGIARTEKYKDFYFDMGGHRFFTKSEEVNRFWNQFLGDGFLKRPRLSRIYYDRKFFNYPLKPLNALKGFGIWHSIIVVLSYLRWQFFPYKNENTFEEWVTNRFGKRLFLTFFKSYTEKVWGISTSELSAGWAAQRIKDLDLKSAVLSMFIKPKITIKTLIEEFNYPKQGPGMLWNEVKRQIENNNGEVWLNSTVCSVNREGNRLVSIVVSNNGKQTIIPGTDFISSMPITEVINKLNPPSPVDVIEAANRLHSRDFLTVCLIVDKPHLFDDNWIYIHDPDVRVGRIQNFKNWSPYMVSDFSKTSLGLEYFCNEGDELWNAADSQLIELGKQELEKIGLARYEDILDGCVFRVEKAYPIYDSNYAKNLSKIREFTDSLENFHTIGRNGLHHYNNQDHAILTGLLAVRNVLFNEKNDLWNVNVEQEYLEEISQEGISSREIDQAVESALGQVFMKIDSKALGFSLGTIIGLFLFSLTLIVLNNGWTNIAEKLWLLGQFFPGYRVDLIGSITGLFYGFIFGFVVGWGFAVLRNTIVLLSMAIIYRRAELQLLRKILDF